METSNFNSIPTPVGSPFTDKLENLLVRFPVIMQFLKFAGIGFLTTAVDFLVLNLISKYLGINEGYKLGGVNVVSFTIAVLHSYFWNKHWAFGDVQVGVWKNFWRTALIGIIGVLGISAAVLGGSAAAPAWYYLIVLGVLAVTEIVVWIKLNLGSLFGSSGLSLGHTMLAFLVVSIIGAAINSGLVGVLTQYWHVTQNPDLNKNIAKVLATVISLMWNFAGYKLVVFRK